LEDRERFREERSKQRATGGMATFLIFGQPTQLRFCNKRFGCSVDTGRFSSENRAAELNLLGNS